MARQFSEPRLLIASKNEGKVQELQELLRNFSVELESAAALSCPEPEENGSTFKENAAIKAEYYGKEAGCPALADDSGLVCDGLDGAPGIYSARWAGENKDFNVAMARLENALKESRIHNYDIDYTAHFVCALALWWPDGHTECFEGKVSGKLVFPPRGEKGFGYDPVFVPQGYSCTFAEMNPEEKNAMSHRTKAFRQLIEACFSVVVD